MVSNDINREGGTFQVMPPRLESLKDGEKFLVVVKVMEGTWSMQRKKGGWESSRDQASSSETGRRGRTPQRSILLDLSGCQQVYIYYRVERQGS